MMFRTISLVIGLVVLAACAEVQKMSDDIVRDRAKVAVSDYVTSRYPGVNVQPVTDCIIDNASSAQLLDIATQSATGNTASSVEVIANIAAKPETLTCIAGNAQALLDL